MGKLSRLLKALHAGREEQAATIAFSIADEAEKTLLEVIADRPIEAYGQSEITYCMEVLFSDQFAEISSLPEARHLLARTLAWDCPGNITGKKLFQVASVQHFVCVMLKEKIEVIESEEIASLDALCAHFNERLCKDHALACEGLRKDEAGKETELAVIARSRAFLALWNTLRTEETDRKKMHRFAIQLVDFLTILQAHPLKDPGEFKADLFLRRMNSCSGMRDYLILSENSFFSLNRLIPSGRRPANAIRQAVLNPEPSSPFTFRFSGH